MTTRTIRAAVIGAGMMGAQHTEAIRRIPNAFVTALADADEARGRQVCEQLGIPNFYIDYREMLEKEKIDVVHNCTPNHLHYPISRSVMEHGLPVYCEKPLGMNSQETKDLCEIARKAGVKAGVNFNYRQNAVVHEMRQRLRDSQPSWGKTYLVRGHYIQDWMMYDSDYNWRCIKEYGGESRTVADIGSHWFDTVQFVTGQKIVRVNAEFSTVLPYRKKFAGKHKTFGGSGEGEYTLVPVYTEDVALVMIQLEDGTLGTVTLSQVSAGQKNNLELSVDGSVCSLTWNQERPDHLLVATRENGMLLRHAGPEMLSGDAVRFGTLPSGHPVGWHDALRNGIAEFYRALCGQDNTVYASLEDGHSVVCVVEACIASSRSHSWTDVIR